MARLRINAVEPGFSPGTGLVREAPAPVRLVMRYGLQPLAPFFRHWSNPKTAARMITRVLTGESGPTGVYYDENGQPMTGSALVQDPEFSDRVVAETRALLARVHV
jgi:hypothetical protein